MKAVNNVFDDFYEKIIDEHLQSKDTERTKDFNDAILAYMGSEESDYRIERLNIKAMMSVSLRIIILHIYLFNLALLQIKTKLFLVRQFSMTWSQIVLVNHKVNSCLTIQD